MIVHPDFDAVSAIIRDVTEREILPRFRHLAKGDIREKNPGDLVTVADIESEKRLTAELTALLPGSTVVGEEGCETDPGLLDALAGDGPVWIVDPVDGTANFAAGKPCFAVIVAYVAHGETVAGWIHDPLADETIVAAVGEGAWIGETRLQVPQGLAIPDMTGSAPKRVRARVAARGTGRNGTPVPGELLQYRCTGREYMDLARGKLHFCRYGLRVKPWDHAAGLLIHAEAGGFSAIGDVGTPYSPVGGILRGAALMAAPDREIWAALKPLLIDDY